MRGWVWRAALLICAAALASASDLGYKPGSKLNLVFANGMRCEVKVMDRVAERIAVAATKPQPSCPSTASILTMRHVVGIRGDPSWTRRVLGVGVYFVGATQALATRGSVATLMTLTGSVIGGVAVGKTSTLDEVQ